MIIIRRHKWINEFIFIDSCCISICSQFTLVIIVDDNELLWILLSRFFFVWLKILLFFVATINFRQQKKRRKDVQRWWWSEIPHTCSNRIINERKKIVSAKKKMPFLMFVFCPYNFTCTKQRSCSSGRRKMNTHTHTNCSPAWRWTRYYEIRYSLVSYWWLKPTLSDTRIPRIGRSHQ